MKYFLRFFLALVISAIVVITYGRIGEAGKAHLTVVRVANMTSKESTNSYTVEQYGIQLKILEPQIVALSIPENKPNATAPVKLNVGVTNNTQTSIPFRIYGALIPEIVGSDSQALHRKEPKNRQVGVGEYDCVLVGVGEQIAISLDARLSWQNNLLQLVVPTSPDYWQVPINLDNSWSFDALGPGQYQVRFTYESPTGNILCLDPQTGQENRIEGIRTGQLATPFVNLRLIQPVGFNNNAVEVDGIRFETLMPERLLTVLNKRRNAESSVQIGIRITNNTLTPFHFSFYNTFIPDLAMPDGRVLRGSYNRNLLIEPKESDFLLVMPGKSVTFFPDITLSWSKRDQFSLVVSSGNGGFCPFGSLKPGIYQLRFRYQKLGDRMQKTTLAGKSIENRLIEKVWSGRVDTPFVEFRLGQA
ncbi:MAG: hypothetical protein EAZ78_21440 [Oscillatoriales cyanobacterium]|uniref:hypothetical protein n=1 Tax=Microcoleus anatoxicus TaxID=2705319 RepID=UPI002972A585|nr:MAG: hypothetical protein EAZ78_21440 [Oscillatoriales cyanobacterium]TAF44732.1 MAG: hypothetical protein EAZ68_05975 [Oscillatoriales cyanobacterium]TAF70024.1 MAG: hypothetical protein EAZ59_06340 [Oscillatoriales cyanobacterium]